VRAETLDPCAPSPISGQPRAETQATLQTQLRLKPAEFWMRPVVVVTPARALGAIESATISVTAPSRVVIRVPKSVLFIAISFGHVRFGDYGLTLVTRLPVGMPATRIHTLMA